MAVKKRPSLSYEDIPIKYDFDESDENIKVSKSFRRLIIILLIATFSIILWANWSNLQPSKVSLWVSDTLLGIGTGEGYPINISGSSVLNGNFQGMGNNIAYVSDTGFNILNRSAKEVAVRQLSFSSPILKIANNFALIYDQGGKGLQIDTNSKEIFKNNFSQNIQTADISKSGIYAVVTNSNSYLSEMTVYLDDNSEKFKYYFSECYIVDISLNDSGNLLTAVGLSTQDGEFKHTVYVFDFNDKTPLIKLEYIGLIYKCEFLSNDKIVAIGEDNLKFINVKKGDVVDYSYNNKELTGYFINDNNEIMLSLSPYADGRNCEIAIVNSSGVCNLNFNVGLKVFSLASKGGNIVILSNGILYKYSYNGDLVSKQNVGIDSKKIIFPTNNEVYILAVSEIRKILI